MWIDVEVKTPENSCTCLCANKSGEIFKSLFMLGDSLTFPEKGFYTYDPTFGWICLCNICWWLPIPKIPNKNEIENKDLIKSINKFIHRFTEAPFTVATFTSGCCYWFAIILMTRFKDENAVLMYDQIDNHFGVKINSRIYDINGDVTNDYNWEEWDKIDDPSLKNIIERDCINFTGE